MDEIDRHLRSLAEGQHGLITRHQALELGMTPQQVWRRATGRWWEPAGSAALRLVGTPRTDAQEALAAVWSAGTGTGLSHHSAAAWWDVPGFPLRPLQVTRGRNSTRRGGDRAAHESRVLPEHHLTTVHGVPVTTPARTVFDLAGSCHPARVERALDTLWARSLVDHDSLDAIIDDLGRRGRAGTSVMRQLRAARPPDFVAPESRLEGRFHRLVADAGDEAFERQVELGDERGCIGRVDAFDRRRRLVVEIDSERFHSAPSDRRNDALRDARLVAAGFAVLRVPEEELVSRPSTTLRRVRSARADLDLRLAG